MMKPILMDTENVRAILEGRKTVTRRVVKPQPEGDLVPMAKDSCWPGYFAIQGTEKVIRPPFQTGDILWVRETWTKDFDVLAWSEVYVYRADYSGRAMRFWHPSIHMPREAARIFLRVCNVWPEQLQEITPDQIDAEGCKEWAYSAASGELLPSGPSFFRIVWDGTIKPSDLPTYGWEANPWVWVIEFERISKEEAER